MFHFSSYCFPWNLFCEILKKTIKFIREYHYYNKIFLILYKRINARAYTFNFILYISPSDLNNNKELLKKVVYNFFFIFVNNSYVFCLCWLKAKRKNVNKIKIKIKTTKKRVSKCLKNNGCFHIRCLLADMPKILYAYV